MTFSPLSTSSRSSCLPMSSVAFLNLRPTRAPPPQPPSPPTPPDPQICLSFGESLSQPPSFTSFSAFDSLLQLSSARTSFPTTASVSHLPTKVPLTVGWQPPDESPFAICFGDLDARHCPTSSTIAYFSDGCHLVDAHTFPPQTFPQVCSSSSSSSSPSNSFRMERIIWMFVEFLALVLWNSDLAYSVLMGLDTLVSTFVLSCSTLIALMRSLTAVCRVYLDFALLQVVSWQLGQRCLSIDNNRPVHLGHWGFHSPHLSSKELIILPNTSLVFSGIVAGSIVLKTVLLDVEARIIVQDCSRSAFADCLASGPMEALFSPPCGFNKVFQSKDVCFVGCSWLDASLVELFSSPLSQSLILSFVVAVSFYSFSTSMYAVVSVYPALCSLVSSLSRG
ncbi:unnamed protein product [Arabidopsis lyrata]|uniref:Expressed protein n=1 Tax=Arabidopsis lyrata subsp. lyrata TaxID=81972 RepID=D7L6E1_ARALL|nr:expressed protein [Arabidopsis lyrata subsp. lyrata]CAH8262806.1 unnamed protein product [Arabidopsis lyrata]